MPAQMLSRAEIVDRWGPLLPGFEPAPPGHRIAAGLPAVLEFDAGSLVLTAFGRVNAGTIRGDRAVADQFLNSFFRI